MFMKKIFLITVLSLNSLFSIYGESLPKINKIVISGNKHVKKYAIMNRLPWKAGEKFDKSKTQAAINNIYSLGYFRQVKIKKETLKNKQINLFIKVEEKKLLAKLLFEGNKTISSAKIRDELHLDKLITIDEETLHQISKGIRKLYSKESYHATTVKTEIIPDEKSPDKANAKFIITQGPKSVVVRINFVGNKKIPSRKFRKMIFTKEEWLLNFLDDGGKYLKETVEDDKRRIEYIYRDHGYLTTTVTKADINFSEDRRKINITFYIKEGDQFIFSKIKAIGDDEVKEKELFEYITIEEGKPYNQTKLKETIDNLKEIWGRKGYIYADVYPQVKPNEDDKTVEVTFNVEKGDKLYANRINITGNKVTRDKVIRRQIDIEEGDLITSTKLNRSRASVEYLSFFERGGVNWRIDRISDKKANLEMNIKEKKTGNLNLGLTYGSEKHASRPSLKGNINITKENIFGLGIDGGAMVQADRHNLQKLEAHFFDPSLFDSNSSGFTTIYKRWEEYQEWANVNELPKEKISGGAVRLGFFLPQLDRRLQFLTEVGIESISNNNPVATGASAAILEPILRQKFQQGTLAWLGLDVIKDTRNHKVYPNKGYKISLNTKLAPPAVNEEYSFIKTELEGSVYTPLIGNDNLVLALHAKTGLIRQTGGTHIFKKKDINNNDIEVLQKKIIPYKELFHMGGQDSVRGFTWGGIGPAWVTNSPLGSKYMMQFNAELIFPLIPDYSMKGHFFYDAGAGWDTPKQDISDTSYIKRDNFNLRHSVGFGLNLTQPMPVKIDWGYKLDRDKAAGESPHEFHLSSNMAF